MQSLDLSRNALHTLADGAFAGLPRLRFLEPQPKLAHRRRARHFSGNPRLAALFLDQNRLNRLPAGLFAGLPQLSFVWLNDNPGAPFHLDPDPGAHRRRRPDAPGPAQVAVRLDAAAPVAFNARLTVSGGTLSSGEVAVATGGDLSGTVTVRQTGTMPVTVGLGPLPTVPATVRGVAFAAGAPLVLDMGTGICNRTPAVRDAILAGISGVSDCASVTETHLAAITGVLTVTSLTSLQAGDFGGLSGLQSLRLGGGGLTALPSDALPASPA